MRDGSCRCEIYVVVEAAVADDNKIPPNHIPPFFATDIVFGFTYS
jgi:hypothetical protein